MDENAIKELMYGGIKEIVSNKEYYYFSQVGTDYCHFTERGETALKEYMNLMAVNIQKAKEKALDKRAKELVIKGLKGEKV